MLSPNPGVSTIVKAMRTPSSSNSKKQRLSRWKIYGVVEELQHTDINRFNPDAFLYMRSLGAVGNFVR